MTGFDIQDASVDDLDQDMDRGRDRDPDRDRGGGGGRDPAWSLLGREELTSWEGCRVPGCGERISPVDVFCPDVNHSDPLVFRRSSLGGSRWWLVNLARTVVVGLVVTAAGRDSSWPIYLLAVAVGLVCIGLPLHAHRLARAVALGGWSLVALVAGAVAAADIGPGGMRWVWTLTVAVPLGLAAWFATRGSVVFTQDEPGGVEREAARGAAGSYLMAVLAAVAWWLSSGSLADRFVDVPDMVQRWLLFAALGAVLGALLVAAVGALLASFGVLDLDVEPRITRLLERRRVTWTYTVHALPDANGRGHDRDTTVGRVAQPVSILAHQLREQVKRSAVALARQPVNGLLAFAHAGQWALLRLVNWLDRRARLLGRRQLFVVRRGRRIARTAAGYAIRTVGSGSPLVLAYGAAVVGALAALALADGLTRYLVDGSLAGLLAGTGWSVVGIAACFVVWERLASVPRADAVRAELRLLGRMAPDLALFLVAAGWVVGLPGTFGYGPIRVGWVTLVGTAVLAVLLLQEELTDRRVKRRHPVSRARARRPREQPPATGTPWRESA